MNSAPETSRLPYGMAKQIVASLRIGDACLVRPAHMVSFHNAARRLGLRLAAVSVEKDGEPMFRMVRVVAGVSGHLTCRRPRRDQFSGRWLRVA